MANNERFQFVDWNRRPYAEAVDEMNLIVEQRIAGNGSDTIIFVEHDPVITMGRRARAEHLVGYASSDGKTIGGIPVVYTDRGGDVTLHSPGQLVIYPVIRLKVREQRLHDLLIAYENLIIQTALAFGVKACRIEGRTGAWTPRGKLASIGIHIRRWTTYHGIALNVSNDLSLFDNIIPCGLHGIKMASLESETNRALDMAEVKKQIASLFQKVWEQMMAR
ncbi:MAG TPA: lipoyl(octanoyl) transferase LipB [Candidatus Sumerlaeota bacterium]|nr:MAG: Octanoyltransferase [candidate division BRC1 bacterium ADurb.Bin183]HOE63938.1 lipoyl(octanoyl) transferase LipB [Candidatus Sumerlaeota bacterium]HRR30026.1 lipoyl(octanoyl) transferase LipB [Candidatus Sumerlaeia bacterium]HON51224.1 lipoyl(octanoyl) transferase LipB [Candidatus Sumerlaeota bacterium]HOR64459.1 lipoyl(octanoyl) transferase LipB [Candidatus Sumerlaeota bacterium]